MTLDEAKDIVRQMYCGSVEATMKLPNSHLHQEAITLVSQAALQGDKEAQGVQICIPSEMHFMGLYPNVMKTFNIFPETPRKNEDN